MFTTEKQKKATAELAKNSIVLLEQVRTLDKKRLKEKKLQPK